MVELTGKWLSKSRRLLKEAARLPNLLIITGWLTFIYFWGVLRWTRSGLFSEPTELWNAPWKFDTVGHAIAGAYLAFSFLYLFRNYVAQGFFQLTGKKVLALVVWAIVEFLLVAWELGEMMYDLWGQPYLPWLEKAQKGDIDTMVDIAVGFAANLLWIIWDYRHNKKYETRHPELYAKERIESALQFLREVSDEVTEGRKAARKQWVAKLLQPFLPKIRKGVNDLLNLLDEISGNGGSDAK